MNLVVFKGDQGDAIDIANTVKDYCANARMNLPAGLDLGTHTDLSIYIRNRLNTMRSTGLLGLTLVFLCLCVFLNIRIAIMTAIGIPVSFLGAVAVGLQGELCIASLTHLYGQGELFVRRQEGDVGHFL